MLKDISEVIGGFLAGLDIKRRWVVLFSIILLAVLGLYFYEVFTGHSYYLSLERKVALLSKLDELSKSGIASNPDLYPIFQDTVHELESRDIKPLTSILPAKINFSSTVFWKIFSGSFVGLFFLTLVLFNMFTEKTPEDRKNMIVGALVFMLIGGAIGALLPIVYSVWVNYIGLPLIILVSLVVLSWTWRNRS